jgi:RNA polymerase sigma-70 factor (ECF subfamily)
MIPTGFSDTMVSRGILLRTRRSARRPSRATPSTPVRIVVTTRAQPIPVPDEPTSVLIAQAQSGDTLARERLASRYLPILRRWAHGRMPARARDISDTDDIVQIALMRAIARIDDIQAESSGAFLAYLRSVLLNHIRDELRRTQRRPEGVELDEELEDFNNPSLIEEMVGLDRLRAYERALTTLTRRQQEVVILHVEFGLDHHEIAAEVQSTPDGARMLLARALSSIAREMGHED